MSRKKKKQALLLGLSQKKEKVEALDFSNKSLYSNIYIVIGKPMNSEYYHISINEVNNSELVNRNRVIVYLSEFIKNIEKYKLHEYVNHFKSFLIVLEEEKIYELEKEEELVSMNSLLYSNLVKKETTHFNKKVIDYFNKLS